jgi:prepilin-type N-terminal cleavage/methylation domain-containing protein
MNRAAKPSAFSLVELLLVVAIITILAGMATVNFSRARKGADEATDFHKENSRRANDAMRGDPMDNRRPGHE